MWSFPEEKTTFFARDPTKQIFLECIDTWCVGFQHIKGFLTESAMGYDKNSVTNVSS